MIDHIHIRSRAPLETARFYIDVFEARETARIGEPLSRITLELAGLNIFIEQAPEAMPKGGVPQHLGLEHLGLRVENIDDAVATLAARGIPLVSGITTLSDTLRIAFFDAPDGVRIELLERK